MSDIIESGIDFPHGKTEYPFENMKRNDSIVLDQTQNANSEKARAYKMITKLRSTPGKGFLKFRFKEINFYPPGHPELAYRTYRCWRTR